MIEQIRSSEELRPCFSGRTLRNAYPNTPKLTDGMLDRANVISGLTRDDPREFDPNKKPTKAQYVAANTNAYLESRDIFDSYATEMIVGKSTKNRLLARTPLIGRNINDQIEIFSGQVEELILFDENSNNVVASTDSGSINEILSPVISSTETAHLRRAAYLNEKDLIKIKKQAGKALGTISEPQQERLMNASGLTREEAKSKMDNIALSAKRMGQVEILTEVGAVAAGAIAAYAFREYGESLSPITATAIGNLEYYGSLIAPVIQDVRMQLILGYSQNAAVTAADSALEDTPKSIRIPAMLLGEVGFQGAKDIVWNIIPFVPNGDLFFLGANTWAIAAHSIRAGWAEWEIRKYQKEQMNEKIVQDLAESGIHIAQTSTQPAKSAFGD